MVTCQQPLVEDRGRARSAALGKKRIVRDLADPAVEAPPATTSRSTSARSPARASISSAGSTRTTSGAYGVRMWVSMRCPMRGTAPAIGRAQPAWRLYNAELSPGAKPMKPIPTDLVFLAAKRTPFGTYGGALKDVSATDLAVHAAKAAVAQAGVKPEDVDNVV